MAFPDKANFVVDCTWVNTNQNIISRLERAYDDFGKIDNLFLCSLADPWLPPNLIACPKYATNIIEIGNTPFGKYRVNALATMCASSFKTYSEAELMLLPDFKHKYLCYQNKPHYHRQVWTRKLIEHDLIDYGIVTLNKYPDQDFAFPELTVREIEESIDAAYTMTGAVDKDDSFSLGGLTIWQNHFLNVVTENRGPGDVFFITEKTFKPLIGMRPFIVLGNDQVITYLSDNGFNTFEEYWKVDSGITDAYDKLLAVVKMVAEMPVDELYGMYLDMFPKLQHNKRRFIEYAAEQEYIFNHLFDPK